MSVNKFFSKIRRMIKKKFMDYGIGVCLSWFDPEKTQISYIYKQINRFKNLKPVTPMHQVVAHQSLKNDALQNNQPFVFFQTLQS